MARRTEKRLRTRGFKLFVSFDEPVDPTTPVYVELGRAAGFRRRGDVGTGEGMGYEQGGHRYPVAQDRGAEISFDLRLNRGARDNMLKEEDIVWLRWLDEDGYGKENVEVLVTGVEEGRPHDGLPTYAVTCQERSDGDDVAPAPAP